MSDRTLRLFTLHDVILMLRTLVLVMWPVATMAAGHGLGSTLQSVSVGDWISLALLSFSSGFAALLTRVLRSLEAAEQLRQGFEANKANLLLVPWWAFASIHMVGSLFVGMLAFFLCQWAGWDSFLEAVVIALASWTGARLADRMADGFSDAVIGRMNALMGVKKD